jgi:hypothetical protein
MKKTTSFIIIFACLSLAAKCQPHMTYGQIYDFEINDEFHYYYQDVPPNAKRITIIDKFYTASVDSVCYVRYNNTYTSHVNWNPNPHLEYSFNTFTDTVCYTNLNDICDSAFIDWPLADTLDNLFYDTLYFSSNWCGQLIYEYQACSGCSFEGYYISVHFGEGIGLVRQSEHWNMMPSTTYDFRLKYFKKGSFECGTPDNTTENIFEFQDNANRIKVFPNPANEFITISGLDESFKGELSVFNSEGKILQRKKIEGSQAVIETSHLSQGVFLILLQSENGFSITEKFVKE